MAQSFLRVAAADRPPFVFFDSSRVGNARCVALTDPLTGRPATTENCSASAHALGVVRIREYADEWQNIKPTCRFYGLLVDLLPVLLSYGAAAADNTTLYYYDVPPSGGQLQNGTWTGRHNQLVCYYDTGEKQCTCEDAS